VSFSKELNEKKAPVIMGAFLFGNLDYKEQTR